MIKIKYCGLKTIDDVENAAEAGVDAVGFVFVRRSKRFIQASQAVELIEHAKKLSLTAVALFADQDEDQVKHVIEICKPEILQFHGSETSDYCEQFNMPYWKAVPMLTEKKYIQYINEHPNAEAYLLDAFGNQHSGGSGQSFHWFQFPEKLKAKLILAGGINIENVDAALTATGAKFIDTSSGIEEYPGVKSKKMMLALANKIKNYN